MSDKHSDNKQATQALIEHLFSAESNSTLKEKLEDLLTPSEMSEISNRLQIFRLLQTGMPQRQIAEQLGVGIATVTRGSRALKNRQI
ncbi:MAG: helix-turn-helix domain-containing protein [Pseudomonadales bacterium]|nr:helix-turn-helix domain-containing protein [Pseudomonadales bacterium]